MHETVIVEGIRTPIGRRAGMLSGIRPDNLAGLVLRQLVKRAGIDPVLIQDVIMGCCNQVGEQGGSIGRVATLIADYPSSVPSVTLDRQCGSSQQAVHFASQAIMCGDMDVVVAAGVESMSRVPIGSSYKGVALSDELTSRYEIIPQGMSAERVTDKWGLSRQQLDEFSCQSHIKAIQAQDEGRFDREIIPVEVTLPDGTKKEVRTDETPRRDTNLEKMASLKPAFVENGKVTAANSSQICDGAAAILLMSKEKALKLGLKPRFRVLARTVIGSDPTIMLTGPIQATFLVLQQADLTIGEIDVFEVNEAFASVPMAWLAETGANSAKLNINGGAIALGHPLGCSGARLMVTMMHELERTGGRYGLQTMCERHGMANATIIERLD